MLLSTCNFGVPTSPSPVQQVRQLLVDDPGNSEYVDMERELKEVTFLLMSLLFDFIFLFLVSFVWIYS